MSFTIEVDDQLIENTLAEPEWPWIIALAYTVRNVAPNAVATMIWALNHYAKGKSADIATGIALSHLYKIVAGETRDFDWSVIDEIERPIIQAIRTGKITSFGRNEPDSPILELDRTIWTGGEIVMNMTSELKSAGERSLSVFDSTFAGQSPIWAYDIHVSAKDVRTLLDAPLVVETDRPAAFLPKYAKAADVRNEPYAHEAAALMRSGMIKAEAIRQVRPDEAMREPDSIDRGIRKALDLMYDNHGNPL